MKEQLYTIPVNEAFEKDCECPVCAMRQSLEKASVEYTLGPSYMEDDIRMVTDRIGFCGKHIKELYRQQNRLGLALIMKTHMDNTIKEVEKFSKAPAAGGGLFKKKEEAPLVEYIKRLERSCFVCERVESVFERYIATVFYLYEKESEFRERFAQSKGFCNKHYALLYAEAPRNLSGAKREEFIEALNQVYLENIKRVRDDLDWFIDKFDYRYAEEPWKNSKDALPRAILKMNSTEID
ncbi:MAG: hypothetical protein J1E35_02440 [Lachnospiraceae bacterium]|nr:hypothetical protein [Lachnospiraceae bacterium]